MKLELAVFVAFVISALFIAFTLVMNAPKIYEEELEKIRLSQIQKVSMKKYARQRKAYIPERSILLAQEAIEELLRKIPIHFNKNDSSLNFNSQLEQEVNVKKKVLTDIVGIVNNLNEDGVLSIATYTDTNGSSQVNLSLSQKRADRLKKYFSKRTNLLFIVAIGYGEALPSTSRRVEINLKKVQ